MYCESVHAITRVIIILKSPLLNNIKHHQLRIKPGQRHKPHAKHNRSSLLAIRLSSVHVPVPRQSIDIFSDFFLHDTVN
jgi:hypothetical protein